MSRFRYGTTRPGPIGRVGGLGLGFRGWPGKNGVQPRDLVPGSKPTTFQATGDMGLGSLEREVQTQNPGDFQQRRADQNAARLDALSEIQPTGAPADVSAALRRQLGDIDQTTSQAIERATADARGHADSVGGTATPEQRGSALRGVLQDAEDSLC